jgi:hypothetical protein
MKRKYQGHPVCRCGWDMARVDSSKLSTQDVKNASFKDIYSCPKCGQVANIISYVYVDRSFLTGTPARETKCRTAFLTVFKSPLKTLRNLSPMYKFF